MTGSGLWRFLAFGIADAEHRAARLTTPVAGEESVTAKLIDQSVLVGAVERAAAWVVLVSGGSAVAAALTPRLEAWTGLDRASRRRLAGLALMTAAAVHVGLVLAAARPPGWLWLIVPCLATAVGGLLVLMSGRPATAARP